MTGFLVTGLGITHQAGQEPDDFWQALCQSRRPRATTPGAIGLGQMNTAGFLSEDQARRMDRVSQILAVTTQKAIAHAGPDAMAMAEQTGMGVSTDLGTTDSIIRFSETILTHGPNRANPLDFPNTVMNAPAGHTCIAAGIKGHNNTVSGAGALSEAFDVLTLGRAKSYVAAGLEEASLWQQQSPLLQYARTQPAPLSRQRDGCWLGEGAACLFLETNERVQSRPARIWARYLGQAMTYDAAGNQSGQDPRGDDLSEAMRLALDRARIAASQIGGLVVSADGQIQSDARMAQALWAVFRDRLPVLPLFAFAGALGHLAGGNEVFGALCACLALAKQTWPASPWFEQDPELPQLRVMKSSTPLACQYILSVTTDLFGVNTAHVFAAA